MVADGWYWLVLLRIITRLASTCTLGLFGDGLSHSEPRTTAQRAITTSWARVSRMETNNDPTNSGARAWADVDRTITSYQ